MTGPGPSPCRAASGVATRAPIAAIREPGFSSPASGKVRIRLAKPDLGEEEVDAVRLVLRSGTLTNGPETERFERAFAERHQVGHAVAMANGTLALTALQLAHGLGPGDEVIVPSLTFISTATSVLHVGATPRFADVDPDTYNIDPDDVARRLTDRTRAIVAVHYGGQPADMDQLRELSRRRGLLLIEDAAEAHGALYRGRSVGGLGDAAIFSFTPTKNMTAGEGGMVTTNDADLARRLRLMRNHGQTAPYRHAVLGYNWRLTEIQAAIGLVQLRKLDSILARKAHNATRMAAHLRGDAGVRPPLVRPDRTHVYMLYTLRVSVARRRRLIDALASAGVEARMYFPPAHLQPIFQDFGPPPSLPATERLMGELLSVPFHSLLTSEEIRRIAEIVRQTDASG